MANNAPTRAEKVASMSMRKRQELVVSLYTNPKEDICVEKKVIILELIPCQVEELVRKIDVKNLISANNPLIEVKTLFKETLIPLTTNLTLEEIMCIAPSEIDKIVEAIQEVNKSFLNKWAALNLTGWAQAVLQVVGQWLIEKAVSGISAANSLKQVIVDVSNTDTPT